MEKEPDEIAKIFRAACELKEDARKSRETLDLDLEAAQKFERAGGMSLDFARQPEVDALVQQQAEAFGHYYLYEHHYCLRHYYYEKHDCLRALEEHGHAGINLTKAVAIAEKAIGEATPDLAEHLRRNVRVWRYYMQSDVIGGLSIEARDALIKGDLVRALDLYRRMVRLSERLVESASDPQLDPTYERIALGNLFGTLTNACQAFAQVCLHHYGEWDADGTQAKLSNEVAREFVDQMFSAYRYGQRAFRSNPEWRHYIDDNNEILSIISEYLSLNKGQWPELFDRYQADPEFLSLMKRVDMEEYKRIEAERAIAGNKAVKLWQAGSFFVFVLWAIGAIVLLLMRQSTEWWQPIVALAGIETILVIIGAFSLRSIGELSEANLKDLIEMAFRQQFKLLTSIVRSIREGWEKRKDKKVTDAPTPTGETTPPIPGEPKAD